MPVVWTNPLPALTEATVSAPPVVSVPAATAWTLPVASTVTSSLTSADVHEATFRAAAASEAETFKFPATLPDTTRFPTVTLPKVDVPVRLIPPAPFMVLPEGIVMPASA